ncbi:unnamed protein product [Fraxinus pennsylvanica]|uniref:Uncharacterized protein n=1 Tax=Fraxinus pennsylvanica TaxID=56036 RepID=A0AAD2A4J9_9LAMI|nr:unnamed protein product [Fraxinus pennsylvanica]
MEWVKRKIRFLKRRNEKLSPWYIENGGKLLEGLIASSNGKYNIPYRVFTVEELNKATNVDFPSLRYGDSRAVMEDETGNYFSGIFQQRGADRPDIIDVAKELVRIQRSVHPI